MGLSCCRSPTHSDFQIGDNDSAPPELARSVQTLKISFSPRKFHLQELAQIIKLEEWELEEINAEKEGLRQFQETGHFQEIGSRPTQARNDVAEEAHCPNNTGGAGGPPPVASTDTPDKSQQRRTGATRLMTPLKKFFVGSKHKHPPVFPSPEEPSHDPFAASREEELPLPANPIRSEPNQACRISPPKTSRRFGRRSPNDERAYNLLEFIRSMTNMENLIFEWTPSCGISDDYNAIGGYLPPLYRAALEASGDGSFLKSLTVNVEMGCWERVLHQSLVFERLERFTVYCRSGWCCCAEAASVLVPFIQRHKERLRELVVVSRECQLGGLWGEVGFIPGLRRLEVEETPRRCDPRASRDVEGGVGGSLWGFLDEHSQILTQISWRLSDANLTPANRDIGVWFSKDHELIHFPHLQVLELQGLQQLPPYLFFNPVLRYLRTFQATLTTLKLHGWKLMPDPFIDILEAIESPLITVLDVGLEKLTSDLFVEMETLLPGLRVLKILYREAVGAWDQENSQQQDPTYLLPGDPMGGCRPISDAASTMSGRQTRTTSAVKRFIEDMELREFNEWEVEELMIRCTRIDRFAKDPHWRAKRGGKAVLNALPSVTLVNGVAREEYLREVEDCEDFIPDLP